MTTTPDQHDAMLLVELAKLAAMSDPDGEFGRRIFSDDFDPESAGMDDKAVRLTLQWVETVGTLVKNGLLNAALAEDWIWWQGLWDRLGPAARREREKYGEPRLYENFELLARPTN